MWTGPEISAPIPAAMLPDKHRAEGLPLENATVLPQPGELVLAYVPARVWGGDDAPVFDLGLFYGPHGRLFFPIGWHAGSVVARVDPAHLPAVAEACRRIRSRGRLHAAVRARGAGMSADDFFELFDLRVDVVVPPGARVLCGAKPGDHFVLHGEMLHLPPGQGFSIYSLAAVLPLLAAKQRPTRCRTTG